MKDRYIILALLGVVGIIMAVAIHHKLLENRALECSEMLHGYSRGTLVPLHEEASIEIGACLLQFNQPLATGENDSE